MGRRGMVVAAVLLVGLLAGCQPAQQLEIDFTIRRTGTISTAVDGQRTVRLSGVLACSKGSPGAADREPLDLFTTLTQGSVSARGLELHDRCSAPRVWTQAVAVEQAFRAGPITVEITACTNPGERIDEDCTIDREVVTLTEVPA